MSKFLTLLSTIIILGSVFFYVYAFTMGVFFVILVVVLTLLFHWRRTITTEIVSLCRDTISTISAQFFIILSLLAAAFWILFTHQTTSPLRSPWESIPFSFFLLYGVVVLVTIMLMWRSGAVLSSGVDDPSGHGVRQRSDERGRKAVSGHAGDANEAREDAPERHTRHHTLLALALLTFLTLSVSLIIFPLGAGFDPFIHQATEKIIAATGTITPKPLYYIGQYALVVFLSKILGISIVWIDKLLVPLLAALFLPWSINTWQNARGRKHGDVNTGLLPLRQAQGRNDNTRGVTRGGGPPSSPSRSLTDAVGWGCSVAGPRAVAPLLFLLLPFFLAPFTTTTPYSLALLLLVVLIFHVPCSTKHVTNLLLAIAAVLIHPLVGIPACIFLLIFYLQKYQNKLLHVTCYILCALAIPTAFLLAAQFSSQIHITFAPQNFLPWLQSLEWHGIYRENRFNAPLDLLYFYGFNIKNIFWFFILTTLSIRIRYQWRGKHGRLPEDERREPPPGGTRMRIATACPSVPDGERVARRRGGSEDEGNCRGRTRLSSYITTFLILLTSYVLMSGFLSFNFLIGYEQADYAKRVLDIAQLFLIPFFLLGIHWWIKKIPRLLAIILLALAITASLFLTYPQQVDSYAVSHAFNTSQADIDAVRWIDADAHGEDYIVLANQAVSAAAIRELGFKKYYQPQPITYNLSPITSIFFYPIPTGSPLYQYYLDMVYKKASSETMREAMHLVGVNRAYFVLNRYWTDFDRIFKEAKKNLQLLHSINNSIFIFALPNQ